MKIKKHQMGGQIEGNQEAPQQGGVEEQLAQVAQQILDSLMQALGDPQAVALVLQMAMEMLQGATQEAGAMPSEGQQFMRKGGKICKKACGGKTCKKACGGKVKMKKKA